MRGRRKPALLSNLDEAGVLFVPAENLRVQLSSDAGRSCGLFVENQDAMRGKIVIATEGGLGQEVVHRFVKTNAHRRALVIEQKV